MVPEVQIRARLAQSPSSFWSNRRCVVQTFFCVAGNRSENDWQSITSNKRHSPNRYWPSSGGVFLDAREQDGSLFLFHTLKRRCDKSLRKEVRYWSCDNVVHQLNRMFFNSWKPDSRKETTLSLFSLGWLLTFNLSILTLTIYLRVILHLKYLFSWCCAAIL